jgi:hypothetical protein
LSAWARFGPKTRLISTEQLIIQTDGSNPSSATVATIARPGVRRANTTRSASEYGIPYLSGRGLSVSAWLHTLAPRSCHDTAIRNPMTLGHRVEAIEPA